MPDFVEYASNDEQVLDQMRGRVAAGQVDEYREKLIKRINNLSRFSNPTDRQKNKTPGLPCRAGRT